MNQEKWYELRQKAELLIKSSPEYENKDTIEDIKRLVEELNIANVELELQNHELNETQNILENLTKEYTDLFDFSPIGKVIIDKEYIIQKVNLTFAALVKAIRSRIIGTSIQQWIHPDDYLFSQEKMVEAQKRETKLSVFWTGKLKSSKREDIPVRFIARKTVGTYDNGIYLAIIDETNDSQIKEENAILLQRMKNAQILESIKSFTQGIAHEFNNVLASIMGYAQVAQLIPNLPHKQKHYFNEIINATKRGKNLLDQSMQFTASETESAVDFDFREMVNEALEKSESSRPQHVEVTLHAKTTDLVLHAPRNNLCNALQQLFLNAYDGLRKQGKSLTIYLESRTFQEVANLPLDPRPQMDDYLYCRISDDGEGIESRHLDKVFDPFFTTRDKHQGKGLGLFLVKNIILNIGGTMFLNSSVGSGTEVHLFLPRGKRGVLKIQDPFPYSGLENQRIVFLDNDPQVTLVFKEFFEIFRMESKVFNDVETFLQDFYRDPEWAQIILSDVDLGEHQGSKILDLIKQQRSEVHLALVSGVIDQGKYPILAKPVDLDEVYRFLRELIIS